MHLLVEVLWTLTAGSAGFTRPLPLSPELMAAQRQEVIRLYDVEAIRFSNGKLKESYPPPGCISSGGTGRFSTYFQVLLECVLATTKYQERFHTGDSNGSCSSSSSSVGDHESEGSSTTATAAPQGGRPLGSGSPPPEMAKKSNFRKLRTRRSTRREAAASDSKRKEGWLNVVRCASSLLALEGTELPLSVEHSEASLAHSLPVHPNSRLIVVTGINPALHAEEAKVSIRRVCNAFGGLYKDQLYLPVTEIIVEVNEASKREGEEKEEEDGGERKEGVKGKEDGAGPGARVEEQHPTAEEGGRGDGESERYLAQERRDGDGSERGGERERETEQTQAAPPPLPPHRKHRLVGHAVLELSCSSNVAATCSRLLALQCLQSTDTTLAVTAVSNSLIPGGEDAPNRALTEYLRMKMVSEGRLTASAEQSLREVYLSSVKREKAGEGGRQGMTMDEVGKDLQLFFSGFSADKCRVKEVVEGVWKAVGKEGGGGGGGRGGRGGGGQRQMEVEVETFLQWCRDQVDKNVTKIWQGLFSSGYDLHFERYRYIHVYLYTMWYIYTVLYTIWYIYTVLYTMWYIYTVLYTMWYIYTVLYTMWYIYTLYCTLYGVYCFVLYSILGIAHCSVICW